MRKRNQTLRRRTFERDKFTCQKCKIQDKSSRTLEAHHIIPLCMGGRDDLQNVITLCSDCHHFAPDKKEDFEEYMESECDGTLTTLLSAWKKVRDEHPELLESVNQIQKVQEKLNLFGK